MASALIKLGGSLITDKSKPLSARKMVIQQVANELYNAYSLDNKPLWVVGTGSGSFGHYLVIKTNYKNGSSDKRKIKLIRENVLSLTDIVMDSLVKAGFTPVRWSPHNFIKEVGGELEVDLSSFFEIINSGKLPLIHGDIIDSDNGTRIMASEEVLEILASAIHKANGQKIDSCVYATSVDGVLDKLKSLIPTLSPLDRPATLQNGGYDVTGGMAQKIEAGFRMKKYAKKVYIVNGMLAGSITKALSGKPVGTVLQTEGLVG